MINKRILGFVILILLLIYPTLAQPPFATSGTSPISAGLTLDFPIVDTAKINERREFTFQVYNTSNGVLLDNETISCSGHVYALNGTILLHVEGLNYSDHGFQFITSPSLFSREDRYSGTLHCNNSIQGGFLSSSFLITESGLHPNNDLLPFMFSSVIVILLALAILWLGEQGVTKWHRLAPRIFGVGIIMMEVLFILFIVYLNASGFLYSSVLGHHFWLMFISLGGLSLFGLIRVFIIMVNPGTDELEPDKDLKKWQK